MADHKFTLEEILNEYSEDGRRSGIRHTSDKPLSHGTLETEKLVNAATSSRPLRQEQAGYDQVVPELSAGDEEQLVDIKSTISHIKADKAAQAVCDWMNLRGIAPYDEQTGRGTVRHLFTRCAMHTPDAVLCIVSARGFGAQTEELVAYLREHCPELTGIVLDINKQKGNVVLAGDFYTLWGVPELTDRLCGLTFTLSPQAFYQVNPVQAERLYERAVEYAVNAPTDQVLDLYCGAGTISLCLARKAAHVIGAEIVPEAIENARRNAERNGIENAEFLCADAGAAAAELARRGVRPDCIVVDPPRKGMSPEAIDAMVSMQPPRIVYVSCDPGTLARDVKLLTQRGYALTQALAVDMFPQTPHVETCVLLSKLQGEEHIETDISLSKREIGAQP